MTKTGKRAVSRRSFLGLLAAAAAFLAARLPWRRNKDALTTARFWRRLPGGK